MNQPSAIAVERAMIAKAYRVDSFALFGVRSKDMNANTFNDWVGVLYTQSGQLLSYVFPATTDPGLYWRQAPMNVKGTAILKPGQYLNAFRVGVHDGYRALQQNAPLTVYRDANHDAALNLDETKLDTGMFGINLHRANAGHVSGAVDRWSAGCQVIADPVHFDFLIDLAVRNNGPFSYTLLREEDLT
jgi:hypothetical protein